MLRQVEGGPIGAPDTLDPAVRGEHLGVPAVAGVVRHLVVHVLPEPNFGGISTDLKIGKSDLS